MVIHSVFDPEFKPYGEVFPGEWGELLKALSHCPCPENGTMYVPSEPSLESTSTFAHLIHKFSGDLPLQLGFCSGHNQKLNCLEFHRDSELNLANEDFILLLARREEVVDGKLDTAKVKAFRVPAGVAVEIYATTLHYAPCGIDGSGFRVLVGLPKGTNVHPVRDSKEPLLWASNKWLYAHPDSKEAHAGAYVGLVGENLSC